MLVTSCDQSSLILPFFRNVHGRIAHMSNIPWIGKDAENNSGDSPRYVCNLNNNMVFSYKVSYDL